MKRLFSAKSIRFVFLGVSGYILAFCQMYVYTQLLNVAYSPAYAITQMCILLLSFGLCRYWIFNSIAQRCFGQWIKYFFTYVIFRFVDWCLFVILNNYIGIKYYVSIFLAMGLVFPFKYFTYKLRVFNDR